MTNNKPKKKPARTRRIPPPLQKLAASSVSSAEDNTEITFSTSPSTTDSTIATPENEPPLLVLEREEPCNEPLIQVALVPESLINKRVLNGRVVKTRIAAFFECGNVPPINVQKAGENGGSEYILAEFCRPSLSINGVAVPCVVIVPDSLPDRRLIRFVSGDMSGVEAMEDELMQGLALYGSSDPAAEEVNEQEKEDVGFPSGAAVPEYLVNFCKATSLASSAKSNESLTWDQVSMSVAIRSTPIASRAAKWLDTIMGFLALAVVAYYWQSICDWIDEQITVEERTLKERVEAVMSKHAPLGFKLNPQADFVLGNVVILVVDVWQYLIIIPALYTKEILIASCIFAAGLNKGWGLSVLFAVSFDAFAVIGTHVGLLHRVISRILRFQLGLIGSLALLMSGKKRNVLRHRVDTLRTDSAQLMIGTMAVFFFFFTLQTTLAYHLLVLAVWTIIFVVQTALFFVCVVLRSLPLNDLYLAFLDRNQAKKYRGAYRPRSFHLAFDDELQLWRLTVIPVSIGNILADWVASIGTVWKRAWSKRWGSQRVLINVLFGHELPTVPPPIV